MGSEPAGERGNTGFARLAERLRATRFAEAAIRGMWLPLVYLACFIALSLVLFPPTQRIKGVRFAEGDVADVDVIAPFTFAVPLGEQEIEINRAQAAVGMPPVYALNGELATRTPAELRTFFSRARDIARRSGLSNSERIALLRELDPGVKRERVEILLDAGIRTTMEREAVSLASRLIERGIVNDGAPLRRHEYGHITVMAEGREETVPVTRIVEQAQLDEIITLEAKRVFGSNERAVRLFGGVLRSHLTPNLLYDIEETKTRRDEAMKKVPKAYTVSKNQRIIAKHDKVTASQVAILETLERKRLDLDLATSRGRHALLYIGKALRILLVALLLGLALIRFQRDILVEKGKITLAAIMLTVYVILMAVVMAVPILDPHLIPAVFVSLVSTAFFGVQAAAIFTIFAAFMIVTHTSLPASHTLLAMLAGAAGIISIAHLRERKGFYAVFLSVSIAYIAGIAAFGLTEGLTLGGLLRASLFGIANSFVCTILVMFLLPIFESLFDVTTNFTLLELSDLNRPLLRRLILEAPGTYHHSIMVGNMAETVAGAVGANNLLARVGAYYHDIGKLAKPEYFFENKGDNVNKHEKLTPSMSALILASHVKEGIDIARREKLPRIVVDAIREHHGTTVMAYFYQKALEYDSHDSVNIDDFRYPGPRPQTKETALIMLADSCEAAVRSLKEPTPPRIRAIVKKIIESRMNDGELDRSRLTLNDVATIREQFIQILTGIFHARIPYPSQEEEPGERGPS